MTLGSRLVQLAVVAVVALGMIGCTSLGGGAGGSPYPPEASREYRGMWVATVANIDWPSKPGLGPEQMRAEMVRILESATKLNLNAIFLQVRPACDAIYQSELEPWTEYLTGSQGTSPGFDPLVEWIAESHRRGIELHAWFNPFRAKQADAKSQPAPTHVSVSHPSWVKISGKEQWLDPGEPDARAHSLRVVLDVVRRYDVDGVHFDDYFYPYPKKDSPFPDQASHAKYTQAGGMLSLADWRRENINQFVRSVYEEVHRVKPHVRVGISPFGIWRPDYPKGIKGFDAYEGLYADSLRWLAAGWVDYLAPQLYWKIDSPQPYGKLLDWWVACSMRTQRRPILVGNFTSKLTDNPDDARSWETAEILDQVVRTRARSDVGAAGNIHFSAVALTNNRRGIADALARGPYASASLPPEMPWLAGRGRPGSPRLDMPAESADDVVVRWKVRSESHPGAGVRRWVVWARYGGLWSMRVSGEDGHLTLPRQGAGGTLDRVGVAEVDEFGRVGSMALMRVGSAAPADEPTARVGP